MHKKSDASFPGKVWTATPKANANYPSTTASSPQPGTTTVTTYAVKQAIKSSQIQVLVGEVAQQKVDVIVNTTGPDINLLSGSVSYSILEAGGKSIQEELTKICPSGLKVGQLTQTNAGTLQCKKVYHVVLQQWVNVDDAAEQLLYRVVSACLQAASKENCTSIAFPALGAGFHGFPGNRSADIMFRAIESFLQNNSNSKLKNVKIVVHPRDDLLKKDFEARRDGITVIHENFLSKEAVLKKKIGSNPGFALRLVVGCLSQLEADVLVNSTQGDLELSIGAVSRSLLETGGKILQTECMDQCPGGLQPGQMIQTQGGKLKCKKVFHVVLPMWKKGAGDSEKSFQSVVIKCLQEASNQKFESIGFPILGVGYLAYPTDISTLLMVTAVLGFLKENPGTSLQTVSIVLHHKDIHIRKHVESQIEQSGELPCKVTAFFTADGTKAVAGTDTHVVAGKVVCQTDLFEQSFYLPGEREALEGSEIKVFSIQPPSGFSINPEEFHFRIVESQFFRDLMKDQVNRHIFQITKVDYVVNPKLVKRFRLAQKRMAEKQVGFEVPVLAFHGTAKDKVESIYKKGFRQPDHQHFEMSTDVGWYGNGIYFSEYPRFAMNYMERSKMLLVCKVLRGKVFKCEKLKLGEAKEPGYDSHADPYGKEIVIYDDDCILPSYIVHFDICKRFKLKNDKDDPNENDDTILEYLTEMEMHKGEEFPGL